MKRIATILLAVSCLLYSEISLASDCNTAVSVTAQETLDASEVNHSLLAESFTGISECSGPDGQADAWFQFVAASSNMFVRSTGIGKFGFGH